MIYLRVKEIAEEKGLSMAKLARRADIDFKTVQRIFHDPYRDISMRTLEKIAKALDVPVINLIEEIDTKKASLHTKKPYERHISLPTQSDQKSPPISKTP